MIKLLEIQLRALVCLIGLSFFHTNLHCEVPSNHLEFSSFIISQHSDIIKQRHNDRIVINNEAIGSIDFEKNEAILLLDHISYLYGPAPILENGDCFYYAKKPFKNVCNVCKHEWEKGGIVIWCPNCGSTDIRSNVPND